MKIQLKKENISFYFLIIILLIIIYFIINIFNYFKITDLCYINVERDVLRGNKQTIFKALNLLKKEDKDNYRAVCRYVDTISEKYCVIADWHISRKEYDEGIGLPGCYVKGSKVIYLRPEKGDTADIIKTRMELIKKYSQFSKNFYTGGQ